MPALSAETRHPEADSAGGTEMVQVRRRAAPPLRFVGSPVCDMEEAGLAIRIWRVRSGGFVLACTLEEDGQFGERYPSVDETMSALEAYCRQLEDLGDVPTGNAAQRLHVADLLEEVARLTLQRRRFLRLAGAALDRFDAWAAGETP